MKTTTERYAEWLNGVREALKADDRTQEEFGRDVGISREYINAIIGGRKKAGDALQDAISRALGMSYDEARVLGRGNVTIGPRIGPGQATIIPARRGANVEPAEMPKRGGMVPVISFVQAGEWHTAVDNLHPGYAEDWVACSPHLGPRSFALRVRGPSMEPEFREGDIVVVDPDKEAVSGDYVVAKLEEEEATFKQYVRDSGRDYLIPLNERFQPMDMTGKDWRIVGRVMERVKKY